MNTPSELKWHFRAISVLAVAILLVDMYYSGRFGATIDTASMIGLSAISLGSGLLLVAVIVFWKSGFVNFAKGLAGVWAVCFAFNILSNMGVATSNRVVEVEKSNLKQAIHLERAKSKEEARRDLVIFQDQLKKLLEKDAWAGAVTASGLRDQVADLRIARESEVKLGGCGPKCRGIENKIADIQGKIAIAEQRQGLDKRIEATKAILAKARTTLADTDAGVSNTAAQASLYSRWTVGWFGDGESTSAVRNSNELMGMMMAIVIAVASVGLTLAAIWHVLMDITPVSGARSSPLLSKADNLEASVSPVPYAPSSSIGVSIKTVGEMNKERLRQLLSGGQLEAAA